MKERIRIIQKDGELLATYKGEVLPYQVDLKVEAPMEEDPRFTITVLGEFEGYKPRTKTDKNLITDWLEKNGNPEIQAKVEADLALEHVKQRVTEILRNTDLPDWAEYVSVDEDGEVYYRNEKPISSNENWDTDKERCLSYIPLNGADWKKCVWKISDLLNDSDVKKNFTTETRDILISFMDELREYVHESHADISKDERDSSEFVDIFLNNELNEIAKTEQKTEKTPDKECSDTDNEHVANVGKPTTDTQPDWENVFTLEEIRGLLSTDRSVEQFHNTITGVVYDRIKPLLDEIDSLKTQVKDEHALTTAYMYGRQDLLDSLKKTQIEVPFELDRNGDIIHEYSNYSLWAHCKDNKIDQTKIERIILQMKSEVEE